MRPKLANSPGSTSVDVVDATLMSVVPDEAFPLAIGLLPDLWNGKPPPALTAIGVTWLAGFDFEIKVVAKLRETNGG